jgi:MFS family permease
MTDNSSVRRNILILTMAQALGASSPPIVISLGGLVGQKLSSDPALVTLPVSLFNLGLALGTLPAAFLMRQLGRRNAYMIGALVGATAGLVAAAGIFSASFLIFCLGTLTAGLYAAYVQSYRFAAADTASGDMKAKAISYVMVGGLIAAIVGPQLVIWTRDTIPDAMFAGSFLSQAVLGLIALPVLSLLRAPKAVKAANASNDTGRPLIEILKMPRFILSVAAGVCSYALMTFVMTAAPIAMVGHGHSVDHAALGIQWHVLAMFGPSFFTGKLLRQGKDHGTRSGPDRRGGSRCTWRLRCRPFLDGANPAWHRLEFRLHRRYSDGHRLPHASRARQGAGRQ